MLAVNYSLTDNNGKDLDLSASLTDSLIRFRSFISVSLVPLTM